MNIHLATHYGMCFGVRDALRLTHNAAKSGPLTILGQLVHNPLVETHFKTLGVQQGNLADTTSSPTTHVVITAHGASDLHRQQWRETGHTITDTTCPLVKKAHHSLAMLVSEGFHPVIIGQVGHVEVQGLRGDFPDADVILHEDDILHLGKRERYGVISQTTQPLERVLALVAQLKAYQPQSSVRFIDTVCRPTKQRQQALQELCQRCELILVIGGRNSNNTRQLVEAAIKYGCRAIQIERAEELQAEWFSEVRNIGVTAGTSTLDETVRSVLDRLQAIKSATPAPSFINRLLAVTH